MPQQNIKILSKNDIEIKGIFTAPENAKGIIIFAHGSGSGRLSPRNNFVARLFEKSGFATLLIDLLSPEEEADRKNVFDIELLASRLETATQWILDKFKKMKIGYFGASTGAAAAICAAAKLPKVIKAVVSRGGRPDMAENCFSKLKAPTLLIVGGDDDEVILLNRSAFEKLSVEKDLVIVPGATHLFEEPGKLEEVARLANEWFVKYL